MNLELVVLVSLLAAFVVLLVKKWGLAEWMQIHCDKFSSQLFSCDLCMSFWASVMICCLACCFVSDWHIVFVPLCSTPITRMLV